MNSFNNHGMLQIVTRRKYHHNRIIIIVRFDRKDLPFIDDHGNRIDKHTEGFGHCNECRRVAELSQFITCRACDNQVCSSDRCSVERNHGYRLCKGCVR